MLENVSPHTELIMCSDSKLQYQRWNSTLNNTKCEKKKKNIFKMKKDIVAKCCHLNSARLI